MSYAKVIEFWQQVAVDKALQDKVDPSKGVVPKLTGSAKADELTALAKIASDAGFECTADELATSEAVMKFWEQVAKDATLQASLRPAQALAAAELASAEVSRIASQAGYRFSGPQLDAVTSVLQGTGWMGDQELSADQLEEVVGGVMMSSSYSTSLNLAVSGKLTTSFRNLVGPGAVAQYM